MVKSVLFDIEVLVIATKKGAISIKCLNISNYNEKLIEILKKKKYFYELS